MEKIIKMRLISAIILSVFSILQVSGQWALPHISVAHVRTEPRHGAEMSTQALMGTPLRVVNKTDNGWMEIEMPDGYRGYIISNSLTFLDDDAMAGWRKKKRLFVTAFSEVKIYNDTTNLREMVTDAVAGDIVEGTLGKHWSRVTLPDGRTGWIKSDDVSPLESVYLEDASSFIINMARHHAGSPYLWGGLSSKGMDCSGLVKMTFYNAGRILLRDASQQAKTGAPVLPNEYVKGDLVFFGNSSGKINHVGIYDSDGYFIESSGMVKRTSLKDKPGYICARRILGNEGSYGIISINSHPWYF